MISYIVDNTSDTVIENGLEGSGSDTIFSSVTFTASDNVENLTLTGSGNINATGNSLNNNLKGNSGNNELTGGSGNDNLRGLGGADTLNGGDGNDHILGQSGDDTLNGEIGDDNLQGGSGADTLNGGSGNDLLHGGDGIDQLSGGSGDDTYIVDNTSDNVIENGLEGSGSDTIFSSVTFTASNNVEKLVLTGSGNINATGNISLMS